MYSAYLHYAFEGWVGIHRLPLELAISLAKDHAKRWNHLVAIVPNGHPSLPILIFVENLD